MDAIYKIETTWNEFVENNDSSDKNFIFRGHTNELINKQFVEWKLISSFNRYYTDLNFRFGGFIGQQLEEALFQSTYGNYLCIQTNNLANADTVTKLYFLQHYGVPTCLLDFTYNPLIALYFAISNIRGHSTSSYDGKGNVTLYSNEYFISIFKINVSLLSDSLKMKHLEHFNNGLFLNYEKYGIRFFYDIRKAYVALDLQPQIRIEGKYENYNLSNQESCFLLYDNCDADDLSFEEFVKTYISENNIKLDKPIIEIFKIPYNSIYRKFRRYHPNSISLFRFLEERHISGRYLFNDFQGLKYDFNFFNQ
jgi:hypothetical protein